MKICFWGSISESIKGNTPGGGELQIALLAKSLAVQGHEVVIIDYELPEGKDFVSEEGVKVFSIKGYDNGVRLLRTITHRLPLLYRYLCDQKADVYYCRIRDFRHILAYYAARKNKARFILGLASDLDALGFKSRCRYFYFKSFNGLWMLFNGILSEIIYPFLFKRADQILVQHSGQKDILKNKGIDSFILPNLISSDLVPNSNGIERNGIVFVGSLDRRKGFADFVNIVNQCPESHFKVIGQPRDRMGRLLYKKLKSYSNVILTGRLSHCETINFISRSQALLSTSPMEGFPNIFIEAWACGIPVISLYVDPGGVIEKEQLGMVAKGDKEKVINFVSELGSNEHPEKLLVYVRKNHLATEEKQKMISRLFSGPVH